MTVFGEESRGDLGRGRLFRYDPLICWVLATIYYRRDIRSELLMKVVAERIMYMLELPTAPGEADRTRKRQAAAMYSFITDLRWGMDLRQIAAILERRPDAIRLSMSKDGELLKRALVSHRLAVESWTGDVLPIDLDGVPTTTAFDRALQDQRMELSRLLERHRTLTSDEAAWFRQISDPDWAM